MTLQKIIEDLDALAPAARLERNALDAIRAERAFTRSEYRLRGVLTKIINAADAAAEINPNADRAELLSYQATVARREPKERGRRRMIEDDRTLDLVDRKSGTKRLHAQPT